MYMDNLTPEKLIDTLNKNYPMVIEHAITGYKAFYDIEQEFISKINKDISINDLLKDSDTKKELAYLIEYANIIQYGKSYFVSQITYNLIQMGNLVDYINIIGPFRNNNEIKDSKVIIEEITGGQKGGVNFVIFGYILDNIYPKIYYPLYIISMSNTHYLNKYEGR